MTEPITKDDLKEFKDDLKEHIGDKVDPLCERIDKMAATLYGREGRNGVVGDLNQIKGSTTAIKWFAGLGGVGGIWATIQSLWK